MNDHVSLREFIERIIKENNIRRDDLRKEDQRWVENQFKALDKALVLQAGAFPTVKDFNGLRTDVTKELALRSKTSSSVTLMFQMIGVVNMVLTLWLGYLLYVKPVG